MKATEAAVRLAPPASRGQCHLSFYCRDCPFSAAAFGSLLKSVALSSIYKERSLVKAVPKAQGNHTLEHILTASSVLADTEQLALWGERFVCMHMLVHMRSIQLTDTRHV